MQIEGPFDASSVTFSVEADVVVVGLGGAGASAALEARSAGAYVIAIERASGAGGSTALAGGYIYLGGGTPTQLANGIADSIDAMYDYLVATTPAPDHSKIRAYCEGSVEHWRWLAAQGVTFNEEYFKGKHFEHQTEESLAWTGNEKLWPYRLCASAAPRGHRAAAPAGTGGAVIMRHLAERMAQAGIETRSDSAVTGLVTDNGHVVGVQVRRFGEIEFIRARNGIILTTGGYGMSRSLVERYCPQLTAPGLEVIGSPNSDGSGLELGLSVGAGTQHLEACFATSPIYPPAKLLEGILVNRDGQRFISEDAYHGSTTAAILRQPGAKAWLICDLDSYDRPVMGQQIVSAWEDMAEMERDLGMLEGALVKTITQYNAAAARQEDPFFHKGTEWLRPISALPFAAIDCSLGAAPFLGFSLGGLATDVDGRVLDAAGDPISGLYAAGATAANIAAAQGMEGYASGTCIGESTYFGRRAGRHAAQALVATLAA